MGGKEGIEKFSTICNIGSGACGSVYLVRNLENKKLYALKKIQLDENRKTRTREAVEREAQILGELKHPHIVAFHESFLAKGEEHTFLCIIQDYCDGGTLDDKIRTAAGQRKYMDEKQVIHWFLQIALAVRFMHGKKVLHRDLKTANVFLNKSGSICKLGDFGIAKSLDTTIDVASTCVGTPCYLAPEMCQDIPYSSKADIWALGCMLYEMLALRPAFDANNLVSLFYKIVQGQHEPLPECYSDKIREVISAVLTKSPEDRPSARGVLRLPYLREELSKFIEEKQFILEKIRVPTRQGSRPYSTSTLQIRSSTESFQSQMLVESSSLQGGSGSSVSSAGGMSVGAGGDMKRATSCRPVLLQRTNSKEKTLVTVAAAPPVAPSQQPQVPPLSANRKATASKPGRVSTIPEESDELERSQRIEQTIRLNQIREEEARSKSSTPTRSRSSTPAKVKANTPLSRTLSHSGDRAPSRTGDNSKAVSKLPKVGGGKNSNTGNSGNTTNKKNNKNTPAAGNKNGKNAGGSSNNKGKAEDKKKVAAKKIPIKEDDNEPVVKSSPYAEQQKLFHAPDRETTYADSIASKEPTFRDNTIVEQTPETERSHHGTPKSSPDRDTAEKVDGQWAMEETMQYSETESDDESDPEPVDPKDSTENTSSAKSLLSSPSLPLLDKLKRELPLGPDLSKRNRIQEPTRTPRIQNPNPLVIQISIENHSSGDAGDDPVRESVHKRMPKINPLGGMTIKPETPQSIQRLPSLGAEHSMLSHKGRNKKSSASRRHRRRMSLESGVSQRTTTAGGAGGGAARPDTRDSLLSVPYEPSTMHDYYSDDFDDYSSGSDIEEDIPEEISANIMRTARSGSFMTQNEIPEIEEELVCGAAADDFDSCDILEEEIEEVEEELDDIVTVAREACEELDSMAEDPIIVEKTQRPNTSRLLKKHCIQVLGREKYDKVLRYCDNNDAIDIKKVEKMVGKEHTKTVSLMLELAKSKDAG